MRSLIKGATSAALSVSSVPSARGVPSRNARVAAALPGRAHQGACAEEVDDLDGVRVLTQQHGGVTEGAVLVPYGESVEEEGVHAFGGFVENLGHVVLARQPRGGGNVGELSFTSPGEVTMDGSNWWGEARALVIVFRFTGKSQALPDSQCLESRGGYKYHVPLRGYGTRRTRHR